MALRHIDSILVVIGQIPRSHALCKSIITLPFLYLHLYINMSSIIKRGFASKTTTFSGQVQSSLFSLTKRAKEFTYILRKEHLLYVNKKAQRTHVATPPTSLVNLSEITQGATPLVVGAKDEGVKRKSRKKDQRR